MKAHICVGLMCVIILFSWLGLNLPTDTTAGLIQSIVDMVIVAVSAFTVLILLLEP